ncbi:MAG: tetratricopeptide repeat protein [Candidatus Hodarchaeota archaeon]
MNLKIDQDHLYNLYIKGDYNLLLEEINKIGYTRPSSSLNELEQSICISYHSRALIRLGKIIEAETVINNYHDFYLENKYSLHHLIHKTSIINFLITKGVITEAIKIGSQIDQVLEKVHKDLPEEFHNWLAFLHFLIGIGHTYQYQGELALEAFQKSMEINQNDTFIQAKCLYYIGLNLLQMGDYHKFLDFFKQSRTLFQSINSPQGTAWILTFLGQYNLHKGDFIQARSLLEESIKLFKSIDDSQGVNLANSLLGIMYYQEGEINKAKILLESSFSSSLEIANPLILSYCFVPLIMIYLEEGNRLEAQSYFEKIDQADLDIDRSFFVEFHYGIAKAIYLKSSSRFVDKARAQEKFRELLRIDALKVEPPLLGYFFLGIFHLCDLYVEEFKLSEDPAIMLEVKQLIDDYYLNVQSLGFKPKLVELSILKAKMMTIQGDVEQAIEILEDAKQIANNNDFYRLEQKVSSEITQLGNEITSWTRMLQQNTPIIERIEKVRLEEYLKAVQRIVTFD